MIFNSKQVKTGLRYVDGEYINFVNRTVNPARYFLDTMRLAFGGSRHNSSDAARKIRVILVSDKKQSTSEEQFTPFSLYRSQLRKNSNVISVHLLLKDVMRAPKLILAQFDVVVLKMSFLTSSSEALRTAQAIRRAANDKRIMYFDGDDDLGVQWPTILRYVDAYVKKHLFRDRNQYLKRFIGKSNLTDFVHRQYGVSFADDPAATESGQVPLELLGKLSVGTNLASDEVIFKLYNKLHNGPQLRSFDNTKEYDVVFRGSVPKDWMFYLRKDIEPALRRLEKSHRVLMPNKRVPLEEYYNEMIRSKICISPFGYGEICWRDFEAVLCGCLLVKPDMSHVETNPDIFMAHETYVPVKWDFSDLEEKCAYYLANDDERKRIVAAAFNVLDDFYKNGGFVKLLNGLLPAPKAR
jgi:hypothetical protein